MKQLDLINKAVFQKDEVKSQIKNIDKAMPEYYQVFPKETKLLPSKTHLSDFSHVSGDQKNSGLLFTAMGTSLGIYVLCKYLEKNNRKETK